MWARRTAVLGTGSLLAYSLFGRGVGTGKDAQPETDAAHAALLQAITVERGGDREKEEERMLEALREHGLVVIPRAFGSTGRGGCVSEEGLEGQGERGKERAAWSQLSCQLMAFSRAAQARSDFTHQFINRHVFDVKQSEAVNDTVIAQCARPFADLVKRYLGVSRVFVSRIVLVNSKAEADKQVFHADNKLGGVTIAIPFSDVTPENGTTEMALGSHKSWLPWNMTFVRPYVDEGACMIYDTRVLHRGLGNYTKQDRPLLLIQMDDPEKLTTQGAMDVVISHGTIPVWLTHTPLNLYFGQQQRPR